MGFYPPTDGPRFVGSLETEKGSNVYKDFFQSDDKKEVLKIANEVCQKEGRRVMVFERGEGVIERFNPPAIDDPPEVTEESEKKVRNKRIKRK